MLRLTIGYINFLAEIVSKDKNPDEAGSSRQAAAPQQKKVVVHSAKGRNERNESTCSYSMYRGGLNCHSQVARML